MSRWKYLGCDEKDSYTYLVTVPGGDSLLCKPYKKEQFYQLGYSSSTSSSCSSLQAVYCKETINTLSAIVYEESDSCTCHIPACFTCPRHDHLPQLFSTISCTQCNTCSCICDQSKKPSLNRDICRLAELVDVSSSVSDLLAKLRESKAQPREGTVKKCEGKQRHKCECRPIQSICLKTVLKKSSCGGCSVKQIKCPVSCCNEKAPICLPCKRELKFVAQSPACKENTNMCPGNIEKDVKINLFVNVKKEEECAPVRHRKKCKCKDKKKKETKIKKCKCNISPPIVICDKKPENKNFLQAIKAIIPNPSKNNKEQTTRCACKKETGKKTYSVTICTNDKGNHSARRKLSSITEHPPEPQGNEIYDQTKLNPNRRSSNKQENLTNKRENTSKHKNDSFHSKDHRQSKNISKPEMDIKATQNYQVQNIAKPEMAKVSHRTKQRSGELNTIYLNNSGSATDRSILMEPEERTVHYMFLQTYERFPFRIAYNGLQRVTYNVKLRYKSILWLGLTDLSDTLKFKKPSSHTVQTERKPLEAPSSLTEMNTNDKFSQVTGIVEQYQDNVKNFLSIVKKFEEYKNQQRILEDMKRKMSNSYHKGSAENFVMRQVIRGKRRVFFTKVKCNYLCRIFCDYIGPLIYFFYLVVFFWVTF